MVTEKEQETRDDKVNGTVNDSSNGTSLVTKHEAKDVHVQVSKGGIDGVNLFNPHELAAAENFMTKIMRSDKGGIKSVNDGLAILMRAKDLNLPFSTCIEHIHVINGKTGVDVHIVKALLSKAGVVFQCTKDYAPRYEYTDGINVYNDTELPDYCVRVVSKHEADEKAKADKEANKDSDDNDSKVYVYPVKYYQDLAGNVYKDYQLNSKQFGIAANRVQIAEISKAGKTPVYRVPAKPVDYTTEYYFSRVLPNGEKVHTVSHFSYSEAVTAGFFEKDTYQKYARIMIGHRAFMLGSRDIASDVIMGVCETTELKQINNVDIVDADVQEL